MKVQYATAPISICEAVRTLPNPPTGNGADVASWSKSNGAVAYVEVTILAGAAVELADGVMLVAEEVHDTFPEESIAVTLTNGTEVVNYTAHGFQTGDGPVRLTGTLPAQLSLTTEYWVIRASANTLQLATSRALALAGTETAFGSDGSSVFLHWVTGVKSLTFALTAVDATANTFTKIAHGLVAAQRVQLSTTSALPASLAVDTDYYVIVVDANTLQLAASAVDAAAGTAINISDVGTGTHTVIYSAYAATSATVFTLFKELNEGYAIVLSDDIAYRERVEHRPGVVAYHLVASLDRFVPITAYVRGLEEDW